MMKNKKVALVIGWGSVKCAAAMGLMRVLRREGIDVDILIAGGGGSIYAATMALGYDVEEIVELNRQLALNAAKISREFKLALADSIILATARANNAVLWTQDEHFKDMDDVKYIEKK